MLLQRNISDTSKNAAARKSAGPVAGDRMQQRDIFLEMRGIDMSFQGVHALDAVSLSLARGEVHALVGENGAGKSTLMKILAGLYIPDSGSIVIDQVERKFRSVADARNAGIRMIFQEFNQVKQMRVMENIFLGREPRTRWGAVDFVAMKKETKATFESMGIEIDPAAYVRDLTVAKQQLVEIVKAVSQKARIIIMDEPTSALSDTEIARLLATVKTLKAEGASIVFISHKLEEIYSICDHVTILRDGRFIHSGPVAGLPESGLIRMMVDREVSELYPKSPAVIGEAILQVEGLSRTGDFDDVSFSLRRGEILGLAGLMGAGRTEVVETIVGSRHADRGTVQVRGRLLKAAHPGQAIACGVIMVPEDRKRHGLILKMSVGDNILLSSLKKCLQKGSLDRRLERGRIGESLKQLQIKAESPSTIAGNLSGGNQQKVVIARVLNADPDIIILDEPTRGIDVKTKSEIHALISGLAARGKAIILISSELAEVLAMSDRIVVLHEGRVTGTLERNEANPLRVMELAMGKTVTEASRHG